MEKLIRLNQAAKQLGVHKQTLRRWVLRGLGPIVTKTPGGFFMFTEGDLRAWHDQLERVRPNGIAT